MRRLVVIALVVFGIGAGVSYADDVPPPSGQVIDWVRQDDPPAVAPTLEQRVNRLEKRVGRLERQVKALQRQH
jgi:hypothetical protein